MRALRGGCTIILLLFTLIACDRAPTYQWHETESPDKTFAIALPGNAISEDTAKRSATGESFISHQLTVRFAHADYAIAWWENPSLKGNADQILSTMRDRGLAPLRSKLIFERSVTVQGYPARDISAVTEFRAAYDNRIVLVGNRVYSLMVVDGSGKHDFRNIARFYNSLALY
jgi:hypothetical protein